MVTHLCRMIPLLSLKIKIFRYILVVMKGIMLVAVFIAQNA